MEDNNELNNDYNQEYNKVLEERSRVLKELQIIEKHGIIKKYNELKADNLTLLKREKELYAKLNEFNYDKCNHVLVTIYNDWEVTNRGCIKCGLNDAGLIDNKMGVYLSNNKNYQRFINSKTINKICDLDLAQEIYSQIIKEHPLIDDDTLIIYFNQYLNNIEKNTLKITKKPY